MTSVFTQTNEVLAQLWKECNPQEDQYLQKEKVVEWIKASLEKTNTLSSVGQALDNLEGLIKEYLIEVHQVNEQQMQSIALTYIEAVDFLRWLTQTNKQEKNEQKSPEDPQQEQNREKQQQAEPQEHHQKQQQQKPQVQTQQMKPSKVQTQLFQSSSSPRLNNSRRYEQKQPELSRVSEKPSQKRSPPKKIKTEVENDHEDVHQNETVSPNEFDLEHISKKYKDYLKIIFEHYCKISYATGNDPTFEQIKHKTTVMTINKFMMFCKDFQIGKVAPNINRSFLVQIFKKNSECYKEMSLEQFCDVIKKLANIGFSEGVQPKNDNQKEQPELLSSEVVKMLDFMDMSTAKRFKEKMKRLNIQYRAGPKTNAQMKVVPEGYKFKFTANNGKSEEQVKQQLQERKKHRSERKILLQQKVTNQQVDPLEYRKRVLSKKTDRVTSKDKYLAPIREGTVQSTNALNKIISQPLPIPQAKKHSYLPPNPPKTISRTSSLSQQVSMNPSQNSTANIFKRQMGYAQMHKIKQSQGYGKKKMIANSLNKSNNGRQSNFRLNSIVEQARQEVMERPKQGYSDMTDSIGTNSREEANRSKNYDVAKINNKIQLINQKNRREKEIQEQLTGIIDMSNDEDEFLRQHLERQQKHNIMNKRLSNRINELDRGL